jgi:hypothetical protein
VGGGFVENLEKIVLPHVGKKESTTRAN